MLQKILDLHLQCKTQEEIGNEVGLARTSVLTKLKEIEQFIKEMSENPNSEIPTIYKEIGQKWKEMSEFKPQLYL